jgi:hypothetical protein
VHAQAPSAGPFDQLGMAVVRHPFGDVARESRGVVELEEAVDDAACGDARLDDLAVVVERMKPRPCLSAATSKVEAIRLIRVDASTVR